MPTTPPDTHPFILTQVSPELMTPERQQRLLVDLSDMDDYYVVFERYGFGGGGASWAEHIETMLEEHDPELLDHVELAGAGEIFRAYTDGPAATARLLALVQPVFADLGALSKYLAQADPTDFFE
ncbi:Imm51 family immunity protein [Hymenobacter lapidiphilus]|uniref:Immunity protein 51 of polymorphic toxin system n=1 Tax=Hymenobacter lapidiphilus TaxID=2608003 RepID=A0A7Y7U6G8_9BACT|nr:Imm51 family immunity protein [Hymenobacter lapidiphilus]NVO31754.1 hypothetical protein [Hymenobacter lapidiphilus]